MQTLMLSISANVCEIQNRSNMSEWNKLILAITDVLDLWVWSH